MREEVELLEYHPDDAALSSKFRGTHVAANARQISYALAVNVNLPGCGLLKLIDATQQRALPTTRSSENGDRLACWDI